MKDFTTKVELYTLSAGEPVIPAANRRLNQYMLARQKLCAADITITTNTHASRETRQIQLGSSKWKVQWSEQRLRKTF